MDYGLDPWAPMGWVGESENRRPIKYPCPTWFEDAEHAMRTDSAAAWYFSRQRSQPHLLERTLQPPFGSPLPIQPQSQQQQVPQCVTMALPPQTSPASEQQQQQQQQHQINPHVSTPLQALQPQQQRPPPSFRAPAPEQRLLRYDRAVGCQYCSWIGDRPDKASEHLLKIHQVTNGKQGVDWVDWGIIKPRYR